jgi:hypothetical protein
VGDGGNLGIPGFEHKSATTFYSRVYERCFRDNPEEGFAYLEALMSGKDPSPGYSILAQVLDKTAHKMVISTNFDNLVADALSIYTETFPLVIGHESLANFVRVVSRRPVICKIHRDLLLAPKNDHRSLRRLHDSWGIALRALFSQYTPLFIGYGGNDASLMDLLESLDRDEIKGQLIWCYHERFEPSKRIVDPVRQHAGALVLLVKLQSSDSEADYMPSYFLLVVMLKSDQLNDAKEVLAQIFDAQLKDIGSGLIAEIEGEIQAAETFYRQLSVDHDNHHHLTHFLMRQNRFDECEEHLKHLEPGDDDKASTRLLALHQWITCDSVSGANGLPTDDSATNQNLAAVACFALAKGEHDSCVRILATLESRAKATWREEVDFAFLTLVHQLLAVSADGREISGLAQLRTLLTCRYPKSWDGFRMLAKLAETVGPKLPKKHRKFVVALAEACYDPVCRNALGNFPQWRGLVLHDLHSARAHLRLDSPSAPRPQPFHPSVEQPRTPCSQVRRLQDYQHRLSSATRTTAPPPDGSPTRLSRR